MFEGILSELLKFGEQILSLLQQLNTFVLNKFGGLLLLITTIAVIAAWHKVRASRRDEKLMRDLVNAIVRYHNKELREEK